MKQSLAFDILLLKLSKLLFQARLQSKSWYNVMYAETSLCKYSTDLFILQTLQNKLPFNLTELLQFTCTISSFLKRMLNEL